jgi:hypothetical protein
MGAGIKVKCTTCPQEYMLYEDTHFYRMKNDVPMVAGMCPRCGHVNSAVMHPLAISLYPPGGAYIDEHGETLPVTKLPYYPGEEGASCHT